MKPKSIYASLLILAAAYAGAAGAGTPIPEQFHGVWGTAASCKAWVSKPAQRLGAPDDGADITKNAIEFGESTCELKRVGKSEPDRLQGSFNCAGEGEESSRQIELTLAKNGTLKIDKGPNLKKCE